MATRFGALPTGTAVTAARREMIAGGVVVAAALLFVLLGARTLPTTLAALIGRGEGTDSLLAALLITNVALLLFGWRRYRDLTAAAAGRADAEARAQTLASRDELTGFLNRRMLGEETAGLLARAERRGTAVALMVVDLDGFKSINDVHGHDIGDQVLKAAAAALAGVLSPSAVVARLDGDTFAAAFLFDPAQPDVAENAAQALLARLAVAQDVGGNRLHISVTVGLASSDADSGTVDALLRRADIAMQAGKKAGGARVVWFDREMERALVTRSAVEAGLREGIPAGQFVPFYEQQIDLSTGRLIGFEVLARWEHPTGVTIAPDNFIPVAEETGLIADLSMSVMRRAFEDARSWDPSITLSVNISPGQLRDPWLAQKIVKLLVETGFPANRLEVEITESSLLDNLALAQSIVGSLKNQGIRLALDDFGTGYSSLAHLRALPFDRIKIDRSFVTSINSNPESAAIVDAITKLGESLNLPITAEGIEDAAIATRLTGLGCNKGQGWHFGKPMAVGAARRLLAERGLLPAARSNPADDADAPSVRTIRRVG